MMEKSYYTAASLTRVLEDFERDYGMSSPDFYAAHVERSEKIAHIPRFHRHTWASFYRDICRMRGDDEFAAHVTATLSLV